MSYGMDGWNKPSGDLISRAEAIDAICEDGTRLERQGQYSMTMTERKQRDVDILEALPSAQPEIIRCKDCEHNRLPATSGNADCEIFYGMTDQYGFCHKSDRRTDDQT